MAEQQFEMTIIAGPTAIIIVANQFLLMRSDTCFVHGKSDFIELRPVSFCPFVLSNRRAIWDWV